MPSRATNNTRALKTWKSRVIAGGPTGAISTESLIATGGAVYVLSATSIEQIAPKSGAIKAHARYQGQQSAGTLALVGRQLWLPAVVHSDLIVQRYTLALKPLPSVTVTSGEPDGLQPVSVTHDPGPYFYLADETHLYSVNIATAKTSTLSAAPKDIAALAMPSGSGDDVIATVQSSSGRGGGQVDTLNPSGQVLRIVRRFGAPGSRPTPSGTPSGGPGALAATSGGIWIEVSTGMAASFEFIRPGSASNPSSYDVPSPSTMTVAGKSSWVGLLGTLTCLSSATGKTLASTHVDGAESDIGAVAADHSHAYAIWKTAERVSLIQFVPPTSCSG